MKINLCGEINNKRKECALFSFI